MMNTIMITILSLSLSGGIFIAVLFLCKPLFKERLSKRWQYYIWLIVLVRLLVPLSFEVNIVGSLFDGITQAGITDFREADALTVVTIPNAPNIQYPQTLQPDIPEMQTSIPYQSVDIPETQAAVIYQYSNIWRAIMSNLWLVWLVVAIVLFVRKITIYQSFVRYIKAGRTPASSFEDLEIFGKLVEQANIKSTIGLYTNSLISSPLLIGFFRPYIVLPTLDISKSDFRYTILHELTHYKRGDMFYKWLVQLTICLHWFNPLVYLMGREINNACEFSCDESVIKDLDYGGMRAYGDTLLNALDIGGKYKNALSSVMLYESKKILKDRLDMIMKFKKKSRTAVIVAMALTMILSLGAVVVGAYVRGNPLAISSNVISENITTDVTGRVSAYDSSSESFTPPNRENRSNIMRTVTEDDEVVLAHFERYGITVNQNNIYYNEQLVREIVFYSNYNTTGLIVFKSSDTSGRIDIYVLIPGTQDSISGSDIENYIRFDVVELDTPLVRNEALPEINIFVPSPNDSIEDSIAELQRVLGWFSIPDLLPYAEAQRIAIEHANIPQPFTVTFRSLSTTTTTDLARRTENDLFFYRISLDYSSGTQEVLVNAVTGEVLTHDPHNTSNPQQTLVAPLLVNSSRLVFDDSEYRWPFHAMSFTNISDKPIVGYTTISLAYDRYGNPLELYWDALNVSADGSIGSVGGHHMTVVGTFPHSPKSYHRIHQHGILSDWFNDIPQSEREYWLKQLTILPGETVADEKGGYSLFYGWNQSAGEHIVEHIITVVMQVNFEDGSVWTNPDIDDWLLNHK